MIKKRLWTISEIAKRGLIEFNGEPIKHLKLWRWTQPKKHKPYLKTIKPDRDRLTCEEWINDFLNATGLAEAGVKLKSATEEEIADQEEQLKELGFEVGDDQ